MLMFIFGLLAEKGLIGQQPDLNKDIGETTTQMGGSCTEGKVGSLRRKYTKKLLLPCRATIQNEGEQVSVTACHAEVMWKSLSWRA